ncbi:MAG: flagellar basal body P-ring formation protein FlgA [Sedimentisphaerales bacterium]|nr:flagellar basal body P-ring formation protein FlgA [Sedimentisphaerales bacterium]
MNHNRSWIVPIICVLCSPSFCVAAGGETGSRDDVLHIHLPREVTVRNALLSLGQVTVITGAEPLASTAAAVRLGRFSVPGQKITLDRATILSRLASQGIAAERAALTGAEAIVVRRRQQVISGDEFVSFARLFLQQNPPGSLACDGTAVARPKDLALSDEPRSMQLVPKFVENGASGYVTVQVAVVVDGQEVGSRSIPLRLRYRCHRAVTLQEIPEGTKLTPENVKIEETVSDRPETGWKSPYGLVALRNLPARTEIRNDMIDTPQPSLVIRRNETVVIRVQRPGFLVTATGLAMQEAHAGQYMKVRNTDSHRVIMCKVNEDGTVEPIL